MKHSLSTLTLAIGLTFSGLAAATTATFDGYNMNLVVSATVLGNGDLQLSSGVLDSQGYGGQGAAWLNTPVSTANSFITSFSFSLARTGYNPMADGIAFVLQNQGADMLGDGGGCVGYCGLNGVGSIIQTWINNTTGLNIKNNLFDSNGLTTQAAPANLGLASLVTGTETVSYDATAHLMSMTGKLNVDGAVYDVSDAANINLYTKFGPSMYAGFTGSTGLSYADQRITNFNISAVPEPETYALLLAGLGLLGFVARRRA